MCQERSGPGQEHDEDAQSGARVTEHLDRKEGTADRSNDGVDGVPGRIDPGNLIGKKFEQKKNASNRDNEGVTQNGERLVWGRERDPVLMNSEASGEYGKIKI